MTSLVLIALMFSLPLLAQCSKSVTLVVLSRHPTEILEAARDAFLKTQYAKQYCISDVKFIQLPPGWWPYYIKSHSVDVAWGGGPTQFDMLFKDGLLRPLESELALNAASQIPNELAGVPLKRIKDGKIYWVAAAISSFGFTVNTDVAAQLGYDWTKLKTWKDLASDDLGLLMLQVGVPVVGIADPTMSTSNTRMYEIILQAYGWDEGWKLLTLLAANSKVYSGSSAVRDAVMNGEIMVGITIDFYGYTAHKQNPACVYVAPQGQTIINGDPIAITVSTKHPKAAEAFLAWVLTDGQEIWLLPFVNRLPANPKVFQTPLGKERRDLYQAYLKILHSKSMKFNDTLALMYEDAMRMYFKATLVDLHDLLQRAWSSLLNAYYVEHKISKDEFEKLKDELASLPSFKDPITGKTEKFTLNYAIEVNSYLMKNPNAMDKFMNAWREGARMKYLRVISSIG